MTQNMYIGTEFRRLFAATSLAEVLAAVDDDFAAVSRTDPVARADAVAAIVAREVPDLIALQEVATWRTGEDASCADVAFDFLDCLLAGLTRRDAAYSRAVTSDVWALASPGASGRWVRLEVRNVVLAGARVSVSAPHGRQFRRTRRIETPGLPAVDLPRGWTCCTATIDGVRFGFVNTHLEEATVPDVQVEQADELVADLDLSRQLVLAGDFNSAAEGGSLSSPSYSRLLAAGLVDVWAAVGTEADGSTWGQANDVANEESSLDQRLDLVLLAGGVRPLSIHRVGHLASDRTPSGRWPSDHAGLVADLEVQPDRRI